MYIPLVLLTDVVLLAEVHEVGDGLGSKELEAVDDIDLCGILSQRLAKVSIRDGEDQSKKCSHKHNGALLPPSKSWVIESWTLCHQGRRAAKPDVGKIIT